MARPISEFAEVIRSKNAGPYELTFDIIFKENSIFEKVKKEKIINKDLICQLYGIDEDKISSIIFFKPARAVKITIIRPISAGAPGERDVYGAQQHAPLLNLEI